MQGGEQGLYAGVGEPCLGNPLPGRGDDWVGDRGECVGALGGAVVESLDAQLGVGWWKADLPQSGHVSQPACHRTAPTGAPTACLGGWGIAPVRVCPANPSARSSDRSALARIDPAASRIAGPSCSRSGPSKIARAIEDAVNRLERRSALAESCSNEAS
jgi:hypothetical protein